MMLPYSMWPPSEVFLIYFQRYCQAVLELSKTLPKRARKYFVELESLEAKYLLQSVEEGGIPFDFALPYDISSTAYHNQTIDKLDIIYRNNKYAILLLFAHII